MAKKLFAEHILLKEEIVPRSRKEFCTCMRLQLLYLTNKHCYM